jgi:hypothetical protein
MISVIIETREVYAPRRETAGRSPVWMRAAMGVLAAWLWAAVAFGAPPVSPVGRNYEGRLAQAMADNDQRQTEAVLEEWWQEASKAEAGDNTEHENVLKATLKLLSNRSQSWRLVAVSVMARHGTAADCAGAASVLSGRDQIDEKRWLVRSLGRKPGESTYKYLELFAKEREYLIRCAAIQAMADLNDVRAVPLLPAYMNSNMPATVRNWNDDDRSCLSMAGYGVARKFLGVRVTGLDQVRLWTPPPLDAPKPAPAALVFTPGSVGGHEMYMIPSFDVYLAIEGVKDPAGVPSPQGMDLQTMLERCAETALRFAEPTFGRVYLPPVRLYLADAKRFSGLAGTPTSFGGVSKGNEIVVRYDNPQVVPGTLIHEYVHVLHQATFEKQPRWLMEGVAESLTRSAKQTVWTRERVAAAGLTDALPDPSPNARRVNKSLVRDVLSWSSGAATGEQESRRYNSAHLLVDFLRFGPWAAPDLRLAALMGRLSRGQAASTAIQDLYGGSAADMDRWIVEWLDRQQAQEP